MKQLSTCKTALIVLSLSLVFSSCTARIDGSLSANGSAQLTVNTSLGAGMTNLIQRLSAAGGQQGPVLDGPAIARSLSGAPGITSASFRNITPSSISGQVRISRVNDFLSAAGGRGFIVFEQSAGAGGRCAINIDRRNSASILELLSPEISDYLNALMAPIVTGEEMNKQEYIELVAVFYNRIISNEIATSRIQVSVEFPGTVTRARGGTFTGRRASFDIPLIDLLVLETPLSYEVAWN